MDQIQRRAFMKGAGIGALAFTVGSAKVMLTPTEAKAQNVPFRILKEPEVNVIEALGEVLVPGAQKAGIAHFRPGRARIRSSCSIRLPIIQRDLPTRMASSANT
jgi:hypothetical protein